MPLVEQVKFTSTIAANTVELKFDLEKAGYAKNSIRLFKCTDSYQLVYQGYRGNKPIAIAAYKDIPDFDVDTSKGLDDMINELRNCLLG